jgi:hypothetical protein
MAKIAYGTVWGTEPEWLSSTHKKGIIDLRISQERMGYKHRM